MITTISQFIKENFYGSNYEPEIIEDNGRQIANYTGILVKKNNKGNWAAFPKVGDKVFAYDDNNGFSATDPKYMEIVQLDIANKSVICEDNGLETHIAFKLRPVLEDDGDLIAYFSILD